MGRKTPRYHPIYRHSLSLYGGGSAYLCSSQNALGVEYAIVHSDSHRPSPLFMPINADSPVIAYILL